MEHFVEIILSAPPDAALTTIANAKATIPIVLIVQRYHVQKTVCTQLEMEGVVTTAAVTRRAFSALITTPDASTTRMIDQINRKVVAVAVLLMITAAAVVLTLFGSGFCSR